MSKKKPEVCFSYDNLDILGAVKKSVFIRGYSWEKDNNHECILVFSRQLLKQTLAAWIDAKKDYCERYDHFCGQMGSIRSKDYKKEKTKMTLLSSRQKDDQEHPVYVKVDVYTIKSFDKECDMEHG